jgi:hypothetical protein
MLLHPKIIETTNKWHASHINLTYCVKMQHVSTCNACIEMAWESLPAWQHAGRLNLISQEIFEEKQDIKNEAREISKFKVTNITIRA